MAESQAEAAVVKLFAAINSGAIDDVAALAGDDTRFIDIAGGEEVRGRDGWKGYWQRYLSAFPDLELEVTHLVSTDEDATIEGLLRGTHKGELASPAGSIPATQKPVDLRFCIVAKVTDGVIVEAREYYDAVTLMLQLGFMPEPVRPD